MVTKISYSEKEIVMMYLNFHKLQIFSRCQMAKTCSFNFIKGHDC